VNISGRQINQCDLYALVVESVEATGADPAGLCLEMTETVYLEAAHSLTRDLYALKRLGVELSIDDFGTGYSSLTYLRRFPVDVVKIDRSFLAGLGTDSHDTAIVEAVIKLGHRLGLTVVAEGVESRRQLIDLRDLECDQGQGFFIGRPEATAMVTERLRGRAPTTTTSSSIMSEPLSPDHVCPDHAWWESSEQ
jgi:EAL domain-containing protein (putative c-di-GMP-specific phosphodiesterase class I)